jgi:hypothetical protein
MLYSDAPVKILIQELEYLKETAIPAFEKLLQEIKEKAQQIERQVKEAEEKPH